MILFERVDAVAIRAVLSRHERMLLGNLLGQLIDVLRDESDPASKRLFPNAYPGAPEDATEFRRYTLTGLVERKINGAQAMRDALVDIGRATVTETDGGTDVGRDADLAPSATTGAAIAPETILLDEQSAWQWLRTLTDLRLTIANRLGIETEGDEGRLDEAAWPLQQSYHWLGVTQESLVAAMESPSPKPTRSPRTH